MPDILIGSRQKFLCRAFGLKETYHLYTDHNPFTTRRRWNIGRSCQDLAVFRMAAGCRGHEFPAHSLIDDVATKQLPNLCPSFRTPVSRPVRVSGMSVLMGSFLKFLSMETSTSQKVQLIKGLSPE